MGGIATVAVGATPIYVEPINVVRPSLALALSGASVLLSWPTNDASEFQLEAVTALRGAWTTRTNPAVPVSDRLQVSVPVSDANTFFRLKQ